MCLTCAVHGFLNCQCEEAERVRRLHATEQRQRGRRNLPPPSNATAPSRVRRPA
jgi:hypothetical protein